MDGGAKEDQDDPARASAPRLGRALGALRRLGLVAVRTLSHQAAGETGRWGLWLPVLFGFGIAVYFSRVSEPAAGEVALLILGAGLGAGVLLWCGPAALRHVLALSLLLPVLGFSVAFQRTQSVAAPVIERETGPVEVVGTLLEVSVTAPNARRLLVAPTEIEGLGAADLPARLRVTARSRCLAELPLEPGREVRFTGVLMPPMAPVAPGAYDFARRAWFERLGGVGFTYGAPEIGPPSPERTMSMRLADGINHLRHAIAGRARAALAGPVGGIAAALITGDRGGITDEDYARLRDAGLAHLLAISGLHLGLVAGGAFFALRFVFALIPPVALGWPTKKVAALLAMGVAIGYLVISGAPVSAQRATLMLGLVFLAVLFDRPAISMRHVAVAAFVILLIAPESLVEAGFQMSFAAVIALVGFYEAWRRWRIGRAETAGAPGVFALGRRAGAYLGALSATSVVAGLATAPFSAFQFHRFANLELIANLAAVPLMGFLVMPMALIGVLLMPFGLEALPFAVMGEGIAAILAIADWVSSLPGAVTVVPAGPPLAFALIVLGGLWLCLMTRAWRLAGLGVMAVGLAVWAGAPRPLLYVDGGAENLAVRGPEGRLIISADRAGSYEVETWRTCNGEDAEAAILPEPGGPGFICDQLGCVMELGRWRIAHIRHPAALADDCRWADIVIARVAVRACPSAEILLDRFDLRYGGAHVLYVEDGALRLESVAAHRGRRPWSHGTR